ncbi:hypothetical protein Acr_00g0080750 [Actinidia rufa]|uniref:Uncharacterized protein n=1 Tax=Actinidia rufa TaxID=165716 RepID=A0A7J0DUI4_9ERIC|nr:hypothetical protein Acr_00g0080750 [Actinidia rufa]
MEGEFLSKFNHVLENSREYLQNLGKKKRLKIVRAILKNPNFDDTDIYYLCMYELQRSSKRSKRKRSRKEETNSLANTDSVTIPVDGTSKAEAPVVGEHKKPMRIRFTMKKRPDDESKGSLISEAPNLEKLKRPMTFRFTMKKRPRDHEEKH